MAGGNRSESKCNCGKSNCHDHSRKCNDACGLQCNEVLANIDQIADETVKTIIASLPTNVATVSNGSTFPDRLNRALGDPLTTSLTGEDLGEMLGTALGSPVPFVSMRDLFVHGFIEMLMNYKLLAKVDCGKSCCKCSDVIKSITKFNSTIRTAKGQINKLINDWLVGVLGGSSPLFLPDQILIVFKSTEFIANFMAFLLDLLAYMHHVMVIWLICGADECSWLDRIKCTAGDIMLTLTLDLDELALDEILPANTPSALKQYMCLHSFADYFVYSSTEGDFFNDMDTINPGIRNAQRGRNAKPVVKFSDKYNSFVSKIAHHN